MIFVCIILLATAAILFLTNPRDEATRWAVLFMLCGSAGSLGVTIRSSILPHLQADHISNPWLNHAVLVLERYAGLLNQELFPYCVFMYSLVYSNLAGRKVKNLSAILLLIPPAVVAALCRTPTFFHINYHWMLVWVTPYLFIAMLLLIIPLFREADPLKRQSRLRTVLVIAPTVMAIWGFNYYAKAEYPEVPDFRYVSVFVAYSFLLFLVFAFFNGALGVKLRFERQRLSSTMRAFSSGTALLNHTIKNELSKMNYLNEKLSLSLKASDLENSRLASDDLNRSIHHMVHMMERFRERTGEISLQENMIAVEALIESTLMLVRPFAERYGIAIHSSIRCKGTVYCDPLHVKEALNNICMNAVEAMAGHGGILSLTAFVVNRNCMIEVRDQGGGIPKTHLSRIFEPFYSLRKSEGNYGLGLTYCYNVMERHEGSIEIQSDGVKETVVTLRFPKKRTFCDGRKGENSSR